MKRSATAAGVVLAAGCALASGATGAAEFYAGVSFGQTSSDDYEDYVRAYFDDGSFTTASFDDSDTGLRFFIGAAINPNFSIELAHLDLGEASTNAQSNGCCFYAPGSVQHSASADGLELGGIGRVPLSEVASLHVRLGILKWDVEESISDSTGAFSGTDDGNDLFYGVGGEYRVGAKFGLRADYTLYSLDTEAQSFDVNMLSASGTLYFGQ